jgi:MHS family proline/betaine transporter-like MFS transporter
VVIIGQFDAVQHGHQRLLAVVHWFDWAAYAYLAGTVATVFFPAENSTTGLLAVFGVFAMSFGIRPIGALVLGPLGDRIGRKRTLSLIIFMLSGATLLTSWG